LSDATSILHSLFRRHILVLLAFKAEKCCMNSPPVRCLVAWHVLYHMLVAVILLELHPIVKYDTLRVKRKWYPTKSSWSVGVDKIVYKSTYQIDFFTFF
jgi:hypothetical protein